MPPELDEYLTDNYGPPPDLCPRAVSVEKTAEMLSIGRTAVYRLVRTGELRCIRIGRRTLIPVSAIDSFVEAATR